MYLIAGWFWFMAYNLLTNTLKSHIEKYEWDNTFGTKAGEKVRVTTNIRHDITNRMSLISIMTVMDCMS